MTMMTEKQMKQRAQRQATARRREMKRRRVMRNRMILAGVIFTLAIIIGTCMYSYASTNEEYEFVPTHEGTFVQFSHTVECGESLGSIAAKYIQQYGSTEDVDDIVDRIINYTGLDRKEATYHLQAGQKIIVPLWIAEDRNPHHSGENN